MPDSNIRALTALRRLRKVETDAARSDLGETLAEETALAARDAAIEGEVEAARQLTGDFDRQGFFHWLARMRTERSQLATALLAAEVRIAAARLELAHRRVAETSAEQALAQAVLTREAEAAGRGQVMLEDVSRALRWAARIRAGPKTR
jgi:hypothetical protein